MMLFCVDGMLVSATDNSPARLSVLTSMPSPPVLVTTKGSAHPRMDIIETREPHSEIFAIFLASYDCVPNSGTVKAATR